MLDFRFRVRDVGVIVLGAAITLAIAAAIGYAFGAIHPHVPQFTVTTWWDWVSIVKEPLETATFEELLFRALIFGLLWRVLQLEVAAILSSVIFALSHIPTGLPMVVFALILGYVVAKAYAKTKRMLVPILIHFLVIVGGMFLLG